jgi:hypothetical protein
VAYFWKLGLTAIVVLAGLLSVAGCGRGNPVAKGAERETRIRLIVLGRFYVDYMNRHRGIPPADVEAFREFLQPYQEELKRFEIESVEELLTSARDGQPFSIVCGKSIVVSDSPDSFWAAYEQEGEDGKRLAIRTYGGEALLDAQEFDREFSGK